jgi:AraC family transcriptional regulator of adaptative response / methylphosphotriester-DNA alkyltransferase methyltransferase
MAAHDQQLAPNRSMDERITEARRLIDSLIASEPFVERTLPKRLGISANHLDRLFLVELGVTPRVYADHARLNWAIYRLANTEDPIKQIAARLGFRQVSHFSHWFHRQTGCSPRDFRRGNIPPDAPAAKPLFPLTHGLRHG